MQFSIDFECASEADLTEVGTENYSKHPSTVVLCMAVNERDVWIPGEAFPFTPAEIQLGVFVAFNVDFERKIWANVCVKKYGWPELPLCAWECSEALAVYHGMPGNLGKFSKAIDATNSKDDDGHKVMLKMCKPRKPTKNNPGKWVRDATSFARLYSYCRQDVAAEKECVDFLPESRIPSYEHRIWLLDKKINDHGIPVDVDLIEAAVEIETEYKGRQKEIFRDITGLNPTQRERVQEWMIDEGLNIDNMARATLEDALENFEGTDGRLKQVVKAYCEFNQNSVAKFRKMKTWHNQGRLHGTLRYHKCHTGRWAGDGPQYQNPPRLSIEDLDNVIEDAKELTASDFIRAYPEPLNVLKGLIRPTVCAEEGYRFICGDFAQVEAIGAAWLADETDVLKMFADGRPLYETTAAKIFGGSYEDIDNPSFERHVGKCAALGAQYGLWGDPGFVNLVKNWTGLDLEPDNAVDIIKAFRKSIPKTVAYWDTLQEKAFDAVRNPGRVCRAGKCRFRFKYPFLECKLPSDRTMRFPFPEIRKRKRHGRMEDSLSYMGIHGTNKQWCRIDTWGARLFENITQAVCRDLLAESMLRVDRHGYDICLHVHDEILCHVPKRFGSAEDFKQIMEVKPDWFDATLTASVWEGERFRK